MGVLYRARLQVNPVHEEKGVKVLGGRYGLDMVAEQGEPTFEETCVPQIKRHEEAKEGEAFLG